MAAITRDEVAHLARLARLALTDDELDHFAGQLDVILASVARVAEVAADDIPPTSHAVPLTNVLRDDVPVPGLLARGRTARRTRRRGRPVPGAAHPGRGVSADEPLERPDEPDPPHRRRHGRGHRLRRGLRGRGRPGAPGPHRRGRPRVHAFLHVDAEGALAAAADVDARRAAGEPLGPLAGVPLALKDVLTTRGMPTTCGSRILEGWRPPYDATVVARLRAAGLVILGKTNMDEFAMGSSTEYSAYGPTRNPWDLEPHPGWLRRRLGGGRRRLRGSAGDRHRHRRLDPPAGAVTGTVGVKPTYGGVSRYGLVALASSLDQAGPCARTVHGRRPAARRDRRARPARLDLDRPRRCPTSSPRPGRADVRGLRVGLVRELSGEGYQPGVRPRFDEAVAVLAELGAEVVEVSCPHFEYALARLLPDPPERGLVQPGPVRRRCATACASATTVTAASRRSWR